MLFLFCFFILILFSCSTFKCYDQLLQDIITPWGIFLFDCAIYKKCLWSEKSNLKLFSLEKYNIKQNIFWKLWSLHWLRGTPGNWVVKKCPSTVFVCGGGGVGGGVGSVGSGNPCSTTKMGLSSRVPLMVFPENASL